MEAMKPSALVRPAMSAQCGSSHHAGHVALLVSRLALPSPPSREVALWTIASCDTLCRAPSFPKKIATKSLRETCEAVRGAVELHDPLLSAAAAQQPLDAKERSSLEPMKDTAVYKHFFVLGMSINLRLDGDLVRVGPSAVHGLGVFAAEDIPKHTCFTAYPTDLLALWEDVVTGHSKRQPGRPRVAALLSHKYASRDVDANKRLRELLFDYGMEMYGVTVYGDPATHSPGACGHMINDPRGTTSEANCVECPIGGGALIGILTLRMVREGEELLLDYGEAYWRARDRNVEQRAQGTRQAKGEKQKTLI